MGKGKHYLVSKLLAKLGCKLLLPSIAKHFGFRIPRPLVMASYVNRSVVAKKGARG